MIGRGGGDRERCKQHYKHIFFCLLQLVRVFCTENIFRKKNVLVLTKPQMRLLLKNPGGTFLQIQTDK